MRIIILKKRPYDNGKPLSLSIGQACYLWKSGKEKSLTMACPVCGEECILIDHVIDWIDDVTVTVTPSVRHDCGSHFNICKNEILFQSDSAKPKEGI